MLAVEIRTRERAPGVLLVQLRAPSGAVFAGAAPLAAAPAGLQGFVTVATTDAEGPLRALGIALPDGFRLIVAARMRLVLDTAQTLASTLLAAGALAVLLALGFGLLTAWRLERRLRAVSLAAEAVMQGDMARRLPLSGAADEFDRLAGTVNAWLARLESVIEGR